MDSYQLQELKTALLEEIQSAFSNKKNPLLKEYEEQTENLIALLELMTKEKESMPQENIDLIMGQDYVILQLERWVDENKKIISHWNTDEESLKKH
ncbi:MAG: hypothetical protein DBW95_01505 [Gammaproteobacteria bacterium]|nr:MAG: hypothetical protein DBW95_01505 [Gammaproteobacteria bacterium]|tara:strand:- start:286 stop:573 length:288 start_codon:yes stop_codon:yes gene_type:complete